MYIEEKQNAEDFKRKAFRKVGAQESAHKRLDQTFFSLADDLNQAIETTTTRKELAEEVTAAVLRAQRKRDRSYKPIKAYPAAVSRIGKDDGNNPSAEMINFLKTRRQPSTRTTRSQKHDDGRHRHQAPCRIIPLRKNSSG
ncbi:MAG: hypothetical protein Q9208_004859 [Pyrenodesmia sp. 3 TL-2023]